MRKLDVPNIRPTLAWKVAACLFGVDRVHRIQGGLANQMFQYAHAWALHDKHPARTFIDTVRYEVAPPDRAYRIEEVFEMSDKFDHISPTVSRWIRQFGLDRSNRSIETTIYYKKSFLENNLRGIVQGYFPSFRYSEAVAPKLRQNFRFKKPLPERNRALADLLQLGNGIAVHVRRGDYLNPENKADFYGMCTPRYYRSALRYIKDRRQTSLVCFFSDDPAWCRHEFSDIADHVVEGNVGEDAWADMALISLCRDSVIANSSYSLWGRWLSDFTDGIDIGPARFMNGGAYGANIDDIMPSHYIRINDRGEPCIGSGDKNTKA